MGTAPVEGDLPGARHDGCLSRVSSTLTLLACVAGVPATSVTSAVLGCVVRPHTQVHRYQTRRQIPAHKQWYLWDHQAHAATEDQSPNSLKNSTPAVFLHVRAFQRLLRERGQITPNQMGFRDQIPTGTPLELVFLRRLIHDH